MTHHPVPPRPLPPARERLRADTAVTNQSHRAVLLGDDHVGVDPRVFLALLSRLMEARRPTVGRWFDPAALCRPLPRLSFDAPRACRRARRARGGGAGEAWRGRA